jgi:hypothetical protein
MLNHARNLQKKVTRFAQRSTARNAGEARRLCASGSGAGGHALRRQQPRGPHHEAPRPAPGSDPGALAHIVDQVIATNAGKADEYRAGKTGLLGFFVGQVMRQSGGNANPALVSELVRERLGG